MPALVPSAAAAPQALTAVSASVTLAPTSQGARASDASALWESAEQRAARAAVLGARWAFREDGLWFPREEVEGAQHRGVLLRGRFAIEGGAKKRLADGTEVVIVSERGTKFSVLASFGTLYREIEQPVLVNDTLYLRKQIYLPRPQREAEKRPSVNEGMSAGGGILFERAAAYGRGPSYIIATPHIHPTVGLPPDGLEILFRNHPRGHHTALLFRGEAYPIDGWLSASAQQHGDWQYVQAEGRPDLVIRFRRRDGRWEIEPWDRMATPISSR
jgi:hypothetical protein